MKYVSVQHGSQTLTSQASLSTAGVTFHQVGSVGLSPASGNPRWRPRIALTRIFVVCTLGVSGSTSTVVTLYKNASTIGTVTLVASQQDKDGMFVVPFNGTSDYLIAKVTAAGTGAKELVVEVTNG